MKSKKSAKYAVFFNTRAKFQQQRTGQASLDPGSTSDIVCARAQFLPHDRFTGLQDISKSV